MSGFGVGEGSYRQVGAAAKPLPTENGVAGGAGVARGAWRNEAAAKPLPTENGVAGGAGGAGGAGVAGGVVEIISKNIQRVIEKRKVLYL